MASSGSRGNLSRSLGIEQYRAQLSRARMLVERVLHHICRRAAAYLQHAARIGSRGLLKVAVVRRQSANVPWPAPLALTGGEDDASDASPARQPQRGPNTTSIPTRPTCSTRNTRPVALNCCRARMRLGNLFRVEERCPAAATALRKFASITTATTLAAPAPAMVARQPPSRRIMPVSFRRFA